MTGISGNVPATFKDFRQLSRDFGTSLKMSPGVPKTFEHSSEVFGKLSEIFESRRDISGNPGHNKVKPHAFDSEKVGRYNIWM